MLSRPAFKRCFRLETVESVGVFLISESDYHLLTGRTYELLADAIDGRSTVDEILDRLDSHNISAAEVYYALMQMQHQGYLVESDTPLPEELAALADRLNVARKVASDRWKSTRFSIKTCGNFNLEPFISRLQSLNLTFDETASLDIVFTEDYLHEDLETINRKAILSQRPWLLVKPVGSTLWIGPIFYPEKTGCWECLAQRLRANRPVEGFIQHKKDSPNCFPPAVSPVPFATETAFNFVAQELLKWTLQPEGYQLYGKLITFDTLTLKTQEHHFIKRPQCQACGDLFYQSNPEPIPVTLNNGKKTFTDDGGHRCFTPEETLKKYDRHLSPITGAVRHLKKAVLPAKGLMHLYYSGHNVAKIHDSLYFLRQGCRSRSAGKGKTDAQAKASALCEALERYSGLFQGYETRYKGRYAEMGDAAIHPHTCLNFSKEQYRTRHQWNVECDNSFNKVLEPFDETAEIEWTPIWSLTENRFKYLPTAYCYYGYPDYPSAACAADSNGCAAGNTKEEAILQGFMELVERDSVALWWYNRVQRPQVDLASFNEPYCEQLQFAYRSINRELWVLDLTSDFNIPVFVAVSRRIDKPIEDIIFGFGAHFDAKIALNRAMTEMNQILPAVSSVAADGSIEYSAGDRVTSDWWKTATAENQPYLVPDPNVPVKVYSDYTYWSAKNLKEDVLTCVQRVKELGMEMLVLDCTRPDIELNVVKVVVPGMRHFWKRLAPGRLYDVPVKLGWLSQRLLESELNPMPMFL